VGNDCFWPIRDVSLLEEALVFYQRKAFNRRVLEICGKK